MYQYSSNSLEELNTCHQDIKDVFMLAIKRSPVDFGISQGHRPVSEQKELYAQGRTKPGNIVTYIDGLNEKSKHNYDPSKAVDVFAYVNGGAIWDERYLSLIAGVVLSCAQELCVDIRWGGNWDRDGEIIDDHDFVDMPHFELL